MRAHLATGEPGAAAPTAFHPGPSPVPLLVKVEFGRPMSEWRVTRPQWVVKRRVNLSVRIR
jgi:hypothetical protein